MNFKDETGDFKTISFMVGQDSSTVDNAFTFFLLLRTDPNQLAVHNY